MSECVSIGTSTGTVMIQSFSIFHFHFLVCFFHLVLHVRHAGAWHLLLQVDPSRAARLRVLRRGNLYGFIYGVNARFEACLPRVARGKR